MSSRYRAAVLLFFLTPSFVSAWAREARFISFSAKDRNGIILRDLKLEEVTLLLNRKPVELRYFGSKNVDTAFVFLIENSPRTAQYSVSMPHLNQINTVDRVRFHLMDDFLYTLVQSGPVLLAEFYKEIKILHGFSDDDYELTNALRAMEPKVAFLDRENIPVGRMLGRGVDLLRERQEKRKILVLFTTTIDHASVNDLEEYRELLRLSDIDLYVVSFAPQFVSGPAFSHEERINRMYFKKLVEETAGKLYLTGAYVFPSEFMDDLQSRLSNSYTVGFYVEPGTERVEYDVEVKLSRPKCNVEYKKKLVF